MARPHRRDLPGRPARYSGEAALEILTRMQAGEPLHVICLGSGGRLPSPSTVRAWAADPRYAWFGRAFQAAKDAQSHLWMEQGITIADGIPENPTPGQVFRAQTQIRARQAVARAYNPTDYGERVLPAGAGGGATVCIYLPGKPQPTGDSAKVIEGSPAKLEDGSDEPGTD